MPLVTFLPSGRAIAVESGSTLLAAARGAGLPLASSCRGVGVCDACKVQVVAGDEGLMHGQAKVDGKPLLPNERLACQARVHGDVTVTTTYW